jgi:heme/copper-type cytochrome/quinol oxidase subunit 2
MRRLLMTFVVLGVPRVALACPVCFGQNDSPMAQATNAGVMAMLVVIVGVLVGFASFFVYLARRARLAATAETASAGASFAASRPQEGTAQC